MRSTDFRQCRADLGFVLSPRFYGIRLPASESRLINTCTTDGKNFQSAKDLESISYRPMIFQGV